MLRYILSSSDSVWLTDLCRSLEVDLIYENIFVFSGKVYTSGIGMFLGFFMGCVFVLSDESFDKAGPSAALVVFFD
jgi:hypothetical protein